MRAILPSARLLTIRPRRHTVSKQYGRLCQPSWARVPPLRSAWSCPGRGDGNSGVLLLRRARATGTDASKCLPCTEYGADAFLFVYFNDYTAHLHKLYGLHKHRAVSAAGQDVIERPVTRLAAAASGRHRQTHCARKSTPPPRKAKT